MSFGYVKTFDRIHFGKLFAILIENNVPLSFIRLILDAYTMRQCCVSWNNSVSKYFAVSNGVKQGGVLSPTLFSLYIDKLLLKLKESGYGCHLNGIYMGALAYADDITITCPSRHGLHKMLVLCNNFGNENYLKKLYEDDVMCEIR